MRDEFFIFQTPFGWSAVVLHGDLLRAVTFGHRNAAAAQEWLEKKLEISVRRSIKKPQIASRIAAALEGELDDFRDVEIDLDYTTPFGKRILQKCRKIGWGATQSYGQLAKAAGFPGAARAVGRVMANNRTPIVVPCHRVIASGGRLGGYSAPQGLTTKRRLLQLEAESASST